MLSLGALVLILLVLLLVVVGLFIQRALPTIRDSKCNTNTHFGDLVDPASSGPSETVGRPLGATSSDASRPSKSSEDLLNQPASVDLSVVVPAYNEESRIGAMLDETLEFLEKRQKANPSFKYEIVVVNDGSKDKTKDRVLDYSRKWGFEKVRLMNLRFNCGKGAAINKGMRFSRGKLVLFADADGATKFADVAGLEKKLNEISKKDLGCVVGSRYLDSDENKAERSIFRKFISLVFHSLVVLVVGADIKDTQCGFKIFTRNAAQLIFPSQHVDRWAFDVEVLYLCHAFEIPIGEVPVTWQEVGGSKVTLSGVLGMVRDIILIRVLYIVGVWKTMTKAKHL